MAGLQPYRSHYRDGAAARFDELRLDRQPEIDLFVAALLARLQPPGELLDVGCGTGRYGAGLVAAGFTVTGLDSSPDQLRHADGLTRTVLADVTSMPLPDAGFDGCTAVLMLHQLDQAAQAEALRECARVLGVDGTLAIKTCSRADLQARPFAEYFPSALPINRQRYPSIPELRRRLADAGFAELELESTQTTQPLSTAQLLDAIRRKHNTTTALLPAAELSSGLTRLEADLGGAEDVEIEHRHTLVFCKRSGKGV